MSENRTVVYTPDAGSGSGSGMMAMLAPLLQQKGIDPNLLMALNSKGNGNGFGGDGSWFLWIIFLFFLFPLFGRNGWGNNGCNDGGNGGGYGVAGIPNLINNDAGRELLMSAIQGNGQAINTLATNLNCSVGQIQQSINGVMTQIQGVGNQVGMSSQQIINSIQSGNCQIAQAIADCCCKTQNAITTQGYEISCLFAIRPIHWLTLQIRTLWLYVMEQLLIRKLSCLNWMLCRIRTCLIKLTSFVKIRVLCLLKFLTMHRQEIFKLSKLKLLRL